MPIAIVRAVVIGMASACLIATGSPSAVIAATPDPNAAQSPAPSAFGSALVSWIAVSPAYAHTGTVVAVASAINCKADCVGLWVSRDGGSTWARAASRNWSPGRLVITVDGQNHETFFGADSSGLRRSDDYGATWTPAGTGGMPTVLPGYSTDHGVVVAAAGGPTDYRLLGGAPENVDGSHGADEDLAFAASPEFPKGGSFSPALLAAMDRTSHLPVVWRCDANFACNQATTLNLDVQASAMTTTATLLYTSLDYAEHGSVFADTPMGVQKSDDGGATFHPLAVAPANGATATATPMMALAPGYREHGTVRTAYVAVFQAYDVQSKSAHTGGGLYRTTDGGASWSGFATTGPFSGGAQAVAVAPDGRIFAGYYAGLGVGGLLCSPDGGRSWQGSCSPVGDHPVAIVPSQRLVCKLGVCTPGSSISTSPTNPATSPGASSQARPTNNPSGVTAIDASARGATSSGSRWSTVGIVATLIAVLAVLALGARLLFKRKEQRDS